MNLYRDFISRLVDRYKDNTALICKKQPGITFGELNAACNALTSGLYDLGMSKGDTIAVCLSNSYRTRQMFWSAGKGGFTVALINARLTPGEAAYIINDSEATCLVASQEFQQKIEGIRDGLKTVRHFIGADPGMPGFQDLEDIIATSPADEVKYDLQEDDLLWLQYTSGTTGFPKGAMYTQESVAVCAQMGLEALRTYSKFHGEIRFLQVAPSYALSGSGWDLMIQASGATVVIMDRFDAGEMMALIEKHRITDVHIVPAMLNMILSSPDFGRYDLRSLKCISYGASPMPPDLLRRGIRKMGPIFMQSYGGSEFGLACLLDSRDHVLEGEPDKVRRLESCGKPAKGVEVKIVDAFGKEVEPGDVGEITIKSPMVMKGYWKMPQETAEVLKDGRYYTGDLGTRDPEGFIYIKDRSKDLIISGGFNVYPTEVENALTKHPAISEVGVFGIPDDQWGETVCAHIVLNPGESVEARDIIDFTGRHLAHYKKPRRIEFVFSLPRTPSGKVLRRKLREPYWQGQDRKV
jgi:long-chain acyl-CoA synthetase